MATEEGGGLASVWFQKIYLVFRNSEAFQLHVFTAKAYRQLYKQRCRHISGNGCSNSKKPW